MNHTAVNSMYTDMSAMHKAIVKRVAAAAHHERDLLSGPYVLGEMRPDSDMELQGSLIGTASLETYSRKIDRNSGDFQIFADVIAASERDNRGCGDEAGTDQCPALLPGVVVSQAEAIVSGDK